MLAERDVGCDWGRRHPRVQYLQHQRLPATHVPSCSTVHRGAPRAVVRRVHGYATRILRVP
ncbi:unnamed protein product [Ectocarpus sp. 12 AP-2014]